MSSACWTWAGIHVLLESNTICCRGVRNNHLKFIQLITNWSQPGWQAEGRLAPLQAPGNPEQGPLRSLQWETVSSNYQFLQQSHFLILFKYFHFQSPRRSSHLVKLHCKHLVDFLSSSLRRWSEGQQFSNLNKIRLQLPVFALATVNQQTWTNNGSFVVFYEGRAREAFFGENK